LTVCPPGGDAFAELEQAENAGDLGDLDRFATRDSVDFVIRQPPKRRRLVIAVHDDFSFASMVRPPHR
jgi:hypothetical protein